MQEGTGGKESGGFAAVIKGLIERERAQGFPGVAGTDVRLRLPIRQALLDALLDAAPRKEGPVKDFRLLLADRDRIVVEVTTAKMLLLPSVWRIEAEVTRHVSFAHDGRLHLTLLNGGMVRMALNIIPLPDWARIEGARVAIDLGLLLRRAELDWLIPLISRCEVNVFPRTLWLEVGLRVPGDTPPPPPSGHLSATPEV